MKKIVSKVGIAIILMLMVMPILQTLLGNGGVQASNPGDIIQGYSYEELASKLGPNQHYKIIYTKYKYDVTYTGTSTVTAWESELKFLKTGKTLNTNMNGLSARIYSSTENYKGKKYNKDTFWFEKQYTVTIKYSLVYTTPHYVNENATFPSIRLNANYGAYGRKSLTTPLSVSSKSIKGRFISARVLVDSTPAPAPTPSTPSTTPSTTPTTPPTTPPSVTPTTPPVTPTPVQKTYTFDANVCTAVYNILKSNGFSVTKPTATTLKMTEASANNVSILNLSGKGLTNLKGLSQFKNLKSLNAQNNKLTDISELTKLTNLTYLNLNNCGLSSIDLTPIKSLTKLQELHLDSNGIWNTEDIGGINSLQKLYLNNNDLSTIDKSVLTNYLKELYVDNNRIGNTSVFDYTKLQKISLKNNECEMSSPYRYMFISQLIDNARSKSSKMYATGGLKFNKCKIQGRDIVLDENVRVATITIVGGPADGTVFTYINTSVKK